MRGADADSLAQVAASFDPNDDATGLVKMLKNDNQFWRMHAQRLLVERDKTDVVPRLSSRRYGSVADAIPA